MPTRKNNRNRHRRKTGPFSFWKDKFIFWNLIFLIFIKAVFSYSGFQFATILKGVPAFAKEEVVSQTNAFRLFLGLGELKENPVLDLAASQKLEDMINGQYFAHTSPSGVSPWHWFEMSNYNYIYAGENLAMGFLTAKDAVDAWADSPSHRQNLLNPNFKEIGIAVAPAKIQNNEGFLVVQLFGTPKPTVVTAIKPSPSPGPLKVSAASPFPVRGATAADFVQPPKENTAAEIPIPIKVTATTPQLDKISKTINTTFIIYSLFVFLASIVFVVFIGARKELVIRTAASFALMILAIVVPVFQISRAALIL